MTIVKFIIVLSIFVLLGVMALCLLIMIFFPTEDLEENEVWRMIEEASAPEGEDKPQKTNE